MRSRKKYDNIVELRLLGDDPTGHLEIESITSSIVRHLQPAYRDLLDIAAYAYLADTDVSRWSERDLLNAKWTRDIHLVVPVLTPGIWSSPPLLRALVEALSVASGDRYTFTFVQREPGGEQLFYELRHDPFPMADAVCLFSGGADSLAGVLYATKERGLTPLLVSHRSSSVLDSRQENLRNLLNAGRVGHGALHHVSVWLNRRGSAAQARENSQRTRGFLFLTLASVLAKELSIPLVLVPENGPVSLNLRKLQQSYNSTLSRTTNPSVLQAFQKLLSAIGGPPVALENPFIFRTKAEVLRELATHGEERLLEESVSCAHTQGMTKQQPHCGTCSQCIDRRIGSIAAGLSAYDPVSRYMCDIFTEPVQSGEPLMQVESHVRYMERVLACESDEALALEFSEIPRLAAALSGPSSDNGRMLVNMLRRYADNFVGAFRQQFNEHVHEMLSRRLPPTCVLRLTGADRLASGAPVEDSAVASLVRDTTVVNIFGGDHHVGDNYSVHGQAGAVGRGAHAHDMMFQQRWEQLRDSLDLKCLAVELGKLREAMKAESTSAEQDKLVGEVADAEVAAREGDGPRVLGRLANAGKWSLGVAERIGVALVVEALKRAGDPSAPLVG